MPSVGRIDPRYMTVQDWTAAVAIDLEEFGSVPQLLNPAAWQDWAATVVGMSAISGVVLPNPYDFASWGDWATRFNDIMTGWS